MRDEPRHSKYVVTSGYATKRNLLNVSRVFQRGKTQIPRDVRDFLDLTNGDKLFWFLEEGKIYVENSRKTTK